MHRSLPAAPEASHETVPFVVVLYGNRLLLERPGAAAIDPSSSTMDVCSASSICYLRSSPNHPELAIAFPSVSRTHSPLFPLGFVVV